LAARLRIAVGGDCDGGRMQRAVGGLSVAARRCERTGALMVLIVLTRPVLPLTTAALAACGSAVLAAEFAISVACATPANASKRPESSSAL